jgi:hypothetical protein
LDEAFLYSASAVARESTAELKFDKAVVMFELKISISLCEIPVDDTFESDIE